MKKILVLCMVMLLLLWGSALASVGVKKDAAMQGQATDIDITGPNSPMTNDGSTWSIPVGPKIAEESATPDTITAKEGGTTFIATSEAAGGKYFDLPVITASNDGLWYKFIAGPGATGLRTNRTIKVHAQDGASIFYTSKGTAGASVQSVVEDASDSYPTITLQAFGSNWYVIDAKGTWAAGS